MSRFSVPVLLVCALAVASTAGAAGESFELLSVMREELDRSMENLAQAGDAPMYYLQYSVTDLHEYNLAVADGGLNAPTESDHRYLDVDVRIGSMELDSTHEIRGGNRRDNYTPTRHVDFPLDADAGEKAIVENTREIYPGVYVAGMVCNAVYGAPRMGPIFGGMLLSGKKVAELIATDLGKPTA